MSEDATSELDVASATSDDENTVSCHLLVFIRLVVHCLDWTEEFVVGI